MVKCADALATRPRCLRPATTVLVALLQRLHAGGLRDVVVGTKGPGAVHRLDRRPRHRQWSPGRDRPLAQVPLRCGDRRDGRRPGRPSHPVRSDPAAGRVPQSRLPLSRRPGRRLPYSTLGSALGGAGRPAAGFVHHRTPYPAGLAAVGDARPAGPNDLVGGPTGPFRSPAAARGPNPWPHPRRTPPVVQRPRSAPIIAADATLCGRDLGALRAVEPPVGFGFGSVPSRPSLVHLTTMIEAQATCRPHGCRF
jgi:hypothetical protein